MANVISMPNTGLSKGSGFDTVRVMCGQGPNWDSFVNQDGVIFPIGQNTSYESPFIMDKNSLPQTDFSEFQKFISTKAKKGARKSRQKVEDEEEVEEDEESDIEMKDNDAMSEDESKSDDSYQVHLTKKTKDQIIEFSKSKKNPLYPNEITAGFKELMKNSLGNIYYQNYQTEYIVYDKALVRVRYIVQLSTKS